MLTALLMAAATPATVAGYEVGVWRRDAAAPVTDCDRLAAYQSDRNAVAPGVERDALDMPKAEAACRAAVERYPAEPRFAYQLARLLSYQHREPEAERRRRGAVKAGYPVAIFVAGHNVAFAENGPHDRCGGGALIARAAEAGDFSASVALADYALTGTFAACAEMPVPARIAVWLKAVEARAHGHFEQLLITILLRDLARA